MRLRGFSNSEWAVRSTRRRFVSSAESARTGCRRSQRISFRINWKTEAISPMPAASPVQMRTRLRLTHSPSTLRLPVFTRVVPPCASFLPDPSFTRHTPNSTFHFYSSVAFYLFRRQPLRSLFRSCGGYGVQGGRRKRDHANISVIYGRIKRIWTIVLCFEQSTTDGLIGRFYVETEIETATWNVWLSFRDQFSGNICQIQFFVRCNSAWLI